MQCHAGPERRHVTRHAVALSVRTDGVPGTTVNVSTSGVLFDGPLLARVGESIHFSLEIGTRPADAMRLHCRGRVVRTAPSGQGMQVAATIDWIEHEC